MTALQPIEPPNGSTVRDEDGHIWRRYDGSAALNFGFRWVCAVKGVCGTWEHVLSICFYVTVTPGEQEG